MTYLTLPMVSTFLFTNRGSTHPSLKKKGTLIHQRHFMVFAVVRKGRNLKLDTCNCNLHIWILMTDMNNQHQRWTQRHGKLHYNYTMKVKLEKNYTSAMKLNLVSVWLPWQACASGANPESFDTSKNSLKCGND